MGKKAREFLPDSTIQRRDGAVKPIHAEPDEDACYEGQAIFERFSRRTPDGDQRSGAGVVRIALALTLLYGCDAVNAYQQPWAGDEPGESEGASR
jgi:hypothetical protein